MAELLSGKIQAELGFETTVAKSMREARDILEDPAVRSDIFLALLDLILPDAPAGQIVDFVMGYGIPCIILTGVLNDETREEIQNKKVVDYVYKESMADVKYILSIIRRIHLNTSIKTLVVDDSALFREYISDLLSTQRLQVLLASDGREALAQLEKNPDIKVILTDYSMPNMDGYELTTHVRKTRGKDELAIIAISEFGNEFRANSRFLKLGANDFLSKPFSREEFLCRINHTLDSLEMFEEIKEKAHRDFLTGLSNRHYFFESGGKVWEDLRRAGRNDAALAVLDIDYFKNINDAHGHDVGDEALRVMAGLLHENARGKDLTARIGGEEFCFLLRDADRETALAYFQSLLEKIASARVQKDDIELGFTVSIGVAMGTAASLEETMVRADELLYKAKRGGRNQVQIE